MVDFVRKEKYGYPDMLAIMECLRAPDGCPWDREQTHASIRRNFLEETYEALDALDRDDPEDLCEELGDVLMQVLFHAQIEAERGRFTMDDVVDRLCQKLVFRHPHVFGVSAGTGDPADADAGTGTGGDAVSDTDAEQAKWDVHGSSQKVLANWEILKRQEHRQTSTAAAMEGVARTLPALWRAEKIHTKASRAGFDWASPADAMSKLEEETAELRAALASGGPVDAPHGVREELGDVLIAAVKVAQMCGVDPEDALHRSCDKYVARYRRVEESARKPLTGYSLEELVCLWKQAKQEQEQTQAGAESQDPGTGAVPENSG